MSDGGQSRRQCGDSRAVRIALMTLAAMLGLISMAARADESAQAKPGQKALYGRWIEILDSIVDRRCGALHMNFSREGDFASGDGSIVLMRSWQALPRNGGLLIQLSNVHDFGTANCEGSAADRISKLGRTRLFAELGDGGTRMKLYFGDKPGPQYIELARDQRQ